MIKKLFCLFLLALAISANVVHYHYHFGNNKPAAKLNNQHLKADSYQSRLDCMMDCYEGGGTQTACSTQCES